VPGFDLVIASVNGIEPQPAVAYRRDSPENQLVIAFELLQLKEGRAKSLHTAAEVGLVLGGKICPSQPSHHRLSSGGRNLKDGRIIYRWKLGIEVQIAPERDQLGIADRVGPGCTARQLC
jgi:hypothetical protein